MAEMIDWNLTNAGSFWLFEPRTDEAAEWAAENFDLEASLDQFGNYLVEPRYAMNLAHTLWEEAGFTIAIEGREVAAILPN
ncbi:hypothetical protein [Xanthobacter flavus]|uniref:hypothetical protein n=1 Tax=Xanthobacter flavus TaxID=281 RepID=UPI0037279EA4